MQIIIFSWNLKMSYNLGFDLEWALDQVFAQLGQI